MLRHVNQRIAARGRGVFDQGQPFVSRPEQTETLNGRCMFGQDGEAGDGFLDLVV